MKDCATGPAKRLDHGKLTPLMLGKPAQTAGRGQPPKLLPPVFYSPLWCNTPVEMACISSSLLNLNQACPSYEQMGVVMLLSYCSWLLTRSRNSGKIARLSHEIPGGWFVIPGKQHYWLHPGEVPACAVTKGLSLTIHAIALGQCI